MRRVLGIELGTTRVKSVLTDDRGNVIATGVCDWEGEITDGLWSYRLEDAVDALRASYADLLRSLGEPLTQIDAIGISGMMHGYMPLDGNDRLLAPIRTWRNSNAERASEELSALFNFRLPPRWVSAQYYQSVLEGLSHVKDIRFLTTLSGYIHYRLTGRKVIGVNDASGIFPLGADGDYDAGMLSLFNARLAEKGINTDFRAIIPDVLPAGSNAGYLTSEGARFIDPSGNLRPGIPLCPPEGDMGTGMVCTDCIAPGTASLSIGTSSNLLVIMDRPMKGYYPEIDVQNTPDGRQAAMVHSSTGSSVIDMWVGLFDEVIRLFGGEASKSEMFARLFGKAVESGADLGGITCYNYLAPVLIPKVDTGVPMLFSRADGDFTLANFMQSQIYSAIAVIDLGMDILRQEKIPITSVYGHGGFFKTPVIGQKAVSAMMGAPVTVMKTAGEGGPWGMALLALYMLHGKGTLASFLSGIFAGAEKTTLSADETDREKFASFMKNYRRGLDAERMLASEKDGR